MSNSFNWTCPVCGAHTTVTSPNCAVKAMGLITSASADDMGVRVQARLIDCPNLECKEQSFKVTVSRANRIVKGSNDVATLDCASPVGIGEFVFLPTTAQPLSKHVPAQVAEDYNEAYLIAKLSPKASATLARRALQGMVRDYFKVHGKRTLHQELEAIKDRCDSDLYAALMGVKSIGNIGAHPEQDVNLIVEVEPGEAETLLKLIHLLDNEWYVARAERQARISQVLELSAAKEEAQRPSTDAAMAGAGLQLARGFQPRQAR